MTLKFLLLINFCSTLRKLMIVMVHDAHLAWSVLSENCSLNFSTYFTRSAIYNCLKLEVLQTDRLMWCQ